MNHALTHTTERKKLKHKINT